MAQKIVKTFADFKSAAEDASTTEILLANDIAMGAGGVNLPVNKGDITIDGGGYKITDYNSLGAGDTIHVADAGNAALTVTLKNAVWSGRNYYGVLCAYDSSNNKNVTLTLDKVTYTGPECMFNRYGAVRFKDCVISIEQNGSASAPQELCEANRVFFAGKVTVRSQTSANAVIWYAFSGAAFTVEENASLDLSAPSTYMWYTDWGASPAIRFAKNSKTVISTKNGLFYGAGTSAHIAASVSVESGASFKAVSAASNGVPVLKCAGPLSVADGGSLQIVSPAAGSSPLLYFAAAASIGFTKPKSVLLYANGANVFSFAAGTSAAPNAIAIDAEMVNIWNTVKTPYAAAGGFDDLPAAAFYKKDYASNVTAKITASGSAVLSNTNNVVSGDGGYPMNADTFNIFAAKALSMGNIPLAVNGITDVSAAISGVTDAASAVRAAYAGNTLNGTADGAGGFSLPLASRLPVGTAVKISVNRDFLIKNVTVISTGSVSVTYLPDLRFYSFAAPYGKSVVPRADPDWHIEVTDTRTSGGEWYLYASVSQPMHSSSASLDGALALFGGGEKQSLSAVPVLVRKGVWSAPPAVTKIVWTEVEGLLLSVLPDFLYEAGNYKTEISWQVTESPL